jgi:hypothetical protein
MGEVVGRHKRGYQPGEPTNQPSWSRRAVVSAPMAAGATVLVAKQAWAEPLPLVQPLAAQVVHEGYGVCQHVNFQTAVYKHQAEVMERYGRMSIGQMRSLYAPSLSNFKIAMAGARQYGVQWNALVATSSTTQAEIEQKVAHMAANNPDLIRAVEGINEPNNEGAGWVGPCVTRQKWIYNAVRSHRQLDHVKVLGPALHDVQLEAVGGAHWQQLVDAGIRPFMDVCAIHNYPAGSTPDSKRAERVQWVYDAFGADYPIKFTEWGYTNTLGPKASRIGGAKAISPEASKFYDCQVVLDFANNGWEVMRYEFLDDPDPTNTVTESNYGLWEVGSIAGDPDTTWTAKPAVKPLSALLRSLRDPGAAYTPNPMRMRVDAPSDVRTCLAQKRDGSTTLWLWRHVQVWDPIAEKSLNPGPVTARVERPKNTYTVEVGPMPIAIDLGVPWSARQAAG